MGFVAQAATLLQVRPDFRLKPRLSSWPGSFQESIENAPRRALHSQCSAGSYPEPITRRSPQLVTASPSSPAPLHVPPPWALPHSAAPASPPPFRPTAPT